jgi:hypothetical protein
VVGLGESEAADPFSGGELRQIFLLLCVAAEFVNRIHDQTRLHRHRGAVAAVDAFDLARDEPVADIVDASAAVTLERRAEEAHLAHFVHDLAMEFFVPVGLQHAGHQFFLAVGAGRIAHHALVAGQLIVEEQRVFPLECRFGGGDRCGHALLLIQCNALEVLEFNLFLAAMQVLPACRRESPGPTYPMPPNSVSRRCPWQI